MNRSHQAKTAVLLFANSAQEEVKHKSIYKGKELFDALTNTTLKTLEKTGLAYFHFSEKEQIGNTFGERFSNAIQTIFDGGYDKVITIGNDTPSLKAHLINEASKLLETNKVVLGPSLDGGFYLLGIQKASFNKQQFTDLPWQTSTIKKILLGLITADQATKVSFLPSLSDLDAAEDIKRLFNFTLLLPKEIAAILLLILQEFRTKYTISSIYFNSTKHPVFYNKGSPNYFSVIF
jgi:hypothetical protein